jgi:hypothetical protein
MPPSQCSIQVQKTFLYRGVSRVWSNRYYTNQTSFPDSSHFNAFSDAVVLLEKTLYASDVTITKTVGYNGGSEIPVFTKSYSTAGTYTPSGFRCPGDCAALVRYATAARTTKNHPLYLFNYYHGVYRNSDPNWDQVQNSQVTNYSAYAAAWIAGFSDGVTTYKRAGPRGASATGQIVEAFITHRDFPR